MRSVVPLVIAVVLLAGCDGPATTTREPAPQAPLAADAGGACQLLDYETVNALLGVEFDIAAAAQKDNSYTCVLQRRGASLPDLVLAVSMTTAGPEVFAAKVRPKDAVAVSGLGKVGYSAPLPATEKTGPGVEVGWLAGNNRILRLRMRMPASGTVDPAVTGRLVELAKDVDLSSI